MTKINPYWVNKGGVSMFPNIDAERARNGMSRAKLASQLGVSYSTMKSWMSGRTDIPSSKLVEMSKIFQVSIDYLLGMSSSVS